MTKEHCLRQLNESDIDAIVAEIGVEKTSTEATKKAPSKETCFDCIAELPFSILKAYPFRF